MHARRTAIQSAVAALAVALLAAPVPVRGQSGDLPAELTGGELLPLSPADDPGKPADADSTDPTSPTDAPADLEGPTTVTPETVGAVPADAVETDPARIVSLWKRHWRLYASRFAPLQDDYVACPSYDYRYPSSRGVTTSGLIRRASRDVKVRQGIVVKTVTIKPDKDDAELAAESLLELEPGQYGHIHSAKVQQVLGPETMLVSDVWLVNASEIQEQKNRELAAVPEIQKPRFDRRRFNGRNIDSDARRRYEQYAREKERRLEQAYQLAVKARDYKLKEIERNYEVREKLIETQGGRGFNEPILVHGFSTARVEQGQRWDGDRPTEGPQLAIVRRERDDKSSRYVAMPAHHFRRSLDEAQFLDLLAKRGMSVAEFVNLVLKIKQNKENRSITGSLEAELAVFDELEKRRKD